MSNNPQQSWTLSLILSQVKNILNNEGNQASSLAPCHEPARGDGMIRPSFRAAAAGNTRMDLAKNSADDGHTKSEHASQPAATRREQRGREGESLFLAKFGVKANV